MTDDEEESLTHRFRCAVDWKVHELMAAAHQRGDQYDPIAYAATIRRQLAAATEQVKTAVVEEYEKALDLHQKAQAQEQGPFQTRAKFNPERSGR